MEPVAGGQRDGEAARRRARRLLGLAAIGLLVRLVVAAVTLGTNDYFLWRTFGQEVAARGLSATYAALATFNHPPLAAGWGALAASAADVTGLPFGLLFKLAPIAADALVAGLLWARWREDGAERAATVVALFAWSPLSILISGFHCNTDPVYAALSLLAAWLLHRRAPLAAGLALSAALHVKLIPVILVAPLAACCRDRREALRFGLGLAAGAAAYLPWLLGDPAFVQRVVGYRPRQSQWGIPLMIGATSLLVPSTKAAAYTALRLFTAASTHVQLLGSGVVALGARRCAAPLEAAATASCLFLVLAAGFGFQYAVAPLPLLFAVRPALAAAYSVIAGAFCAVAYATAVRQAWPLAVFFEPALLPAHVQVLSLAAWGLLLAHLLRRPVSARSDTPPPAR